MTFFNKIRWIASILLVFFIVLSTNLIDRDNFNKLSYSVKTIYEDRIVASDLLFDMARLVQKKEIAVVTSDSTFFGEINSKIDREMDNLLVRYSQTKLTEKEQVSFDGLKEELVKLRGLERGNIALEKQNLLAGIDKVHAHLYDLSKIQVQEGRRQMFISNRAKNTIELFTQIEIIFLVIMAVIIQIVIFYKPQEMTP